MDLTEKIGLCFFACEEQQPYTDQRGRRSPKNGNRPRRGRSTQKRLFLSPAAIFNLCGGLTEGQSGGKRFCRKACTVMKHSKNQAGTLLPQHAYIMLPGAHTLHPFTIFSFQHFTKKTINKLSSTHMTLEEAVTLQLLCSSTLESNLEVKFTNFIIIDQNKETTTNQPNTPLASATTPNNYINQFAQLP